MDSDEAISTQAVNDQFTRMRQHRLFKDKQSGDILEFLVNGYLAGNRRGFSQDDILDVVPVAAGKHDGSEEYGGDGDTTTKQEAKIRQLIYRLRRDLTQYYHAPESLGEKDKVIISVPIGGLYKIVVSGRTGSDAGPERLAFERLPRGVTIYSTWSKFVQLLETIQRDETEVARKAIPGVQEAQTATDLRIAAFAFTNVGVPEDPLGELVERGVRVKVLLTNPILGEDLLNTRNKIRPRKRDTALGELRGQISALRELKERLSGEPGDFDFAVSSLMPYGFVAFCSKFAVLGLLLADRSYGEGPMFVIDCTSNRSLWEMLRTEWERRWWHAQTEAEQQPAVKHPHGIDRVVQQIIADADLITAIEAHAPDETHIWVAAHDLSNVGDSSTFSELVRKIVGENASRGISYSYVYPIEWAGRSRVENLRKCFHGTRGKLYLYPISEGRFKEITLVPSHFISFHPDNAAGDTYMQLPLQTGEKGWIKLDPASAGQVVAKMKQIMDEHPERSI